MKIVVIDYGAGNTRSVQYAVERLGYKAIVSDKAEVIENADRVIFPGVGAAGTAMEALQKKGLDRLLPKLKQPVLGICLGMQLMCAFSEENETKGLGIFPVDVKRFPSGTLKVPHMGWNTIKRTDHKLYKDLETSMDMYFVHSYYVPLMENTIASCIYGFPFSAVLQRDNFYACQFHPEKSAGLGQQLFKNFLDQ